MASLTVFDAYSRYLEVANPNVKSMIKSVFVRFLVPCWGGQAPEGSRVTPFEIFAAHEYAKTLPVIILCVSSDKLETILEEKGIPKQNRKSYRSTYKAFFNWAEENNYFNDYFLAEEKESEPDVKIKSLKGKFKFKHNHHGISFKQPYTLMALRGGKLLYENDYINEKLKKEVEDFQKFRRDNNISPATIVMGTKLIYQMLGWLHRYKGVSLEDLSLNSIISYQKLSVSAQTCLDNNGNIDFNKLSLTKATTRQTAIEFSKENIKTIEDYLDFVGGHPRTKALVVIACVNIAKFVFRNELDNDEYINYSNLPIIQKLNQLNNNLNKKTKQTPPTISHNCKSIHWESVYPLLDKLREKSCIDSYTSITNGKQSCHKRPKTAMFNDLQDFLSIAFMTLMPPDRTRTFSDLEIGKTLVKGVYMNSVFTPIDKLKNKSNSKWYIHLQPEDYKTGKVYGEFWGEVPNYQFSDETFFYDYIERWINEGRECRQKCDHNYFFRGIKTYKKFRSQDFSSMIRYIFYKETGVPVTPKELRKMYVTYLKDQGVSESELEAAAWWMKHSRMMQSKIYDQQDKTNKMAPIQSFNQRMFEQNMQK